MRKTGAARSFTLIELLIVVAIISILSSIAVPNFLEAQTRAKVSRVKADMASMATALEIYATDHNNYPYRRHPNWKDGYYAPMLSERMDHLHVITTPVRYITTIPKDVFEMKVPYPLDVIDYYDREQVNILTQQVQGSLDVGEDLWMLVSVGPDGYLGVSRGGEPGGYPDQPPTLVFSINEEYDPENGTISPGNIYRLQGSGSFNKIVRGE